MRFFILFLSRGTIDGANGPRGRRGLGGSEVAGEVATTEYVSGWARRAVACFWGPRRGLEKSVLLAEAAS